MENPERDDYRALIGEVFSIAFTDASIQLELASVDDIPYSGGAERPAPFSLTFLGPVEPVVLQATYEMTRGDERYVIFIVPIGPDPQTKRMQYEAIFN
ncbi:MAG: hypothetical protein QOK47_1189 [Actinomycetota bacterium]|nr:hypothetical protein [Actinomycetota bacterium]